jgi:hypothetical protein
MLESLKAKMSNRAASNLKNKPNKPLTLHGIFGHYIHKKTIIKEMKKVGFVVNQEFDFLPNQFLIIFVKTI